MAIARGVKYSWLKAKTCKSIAQKGWDALKTEIEPDGNRPPNLHGHDVFGRRYVL
ncbi:hypothetical protein [Spirosoma flavum]|uniref:Transposase n=1 Tax=Spirosoma flavum TaxID=2048557 RepID=A0ABW6AJT3_9BACT